MITQQLNSAIELIRHPERMDRSTIEILEEAIEQYPFYQTLHLLLLQNLYKVHDPRFSQQLKRLAVMVADRAVLFDMVEGLNYDIPVTRLEDEGPEHSGGDITLSLIDNFLRGVDELPYTHGPSTDNADSSSDYSFYLEQMPDIDEDANSGHMSPSQSPKAKPNNPASSVTSAKTSPVAQSATMGPKSAPVQQRSANMEHKPAPKVPNHDDDADNEFTVSSIRQHLDEYNGDESFMPIEDSFDDEKNTPYFTETMAGMYIKQQKYSQALEIIKAISAQNPKKSVYFADQIRYLELLIRLNKSK